MEAYAWPASALLVAVVFMLVFRRQIGGLLSRITEVGRGGIRAIAGEQQGPIAQDTTALYAALKEYDNPMMAAQLEGIRTGLKGKGLDGSEATEFLIRQLAGAQLALSYTQIDVNIWGTQIDLLHQLNGATQGHTAEELRRFYDVGAAGSPAVYENYPYESYLRYLVDSNLVVQQMDRYMITEFGREFLVYLAVTGRTGWRPQ